MKPAVYFNSKELYAIAVEMERNGLAYYTEIAGKADARQAEKIFHYLASAEKKHLKTFKELWSNAGGKKPPESYHGEYKKYINALIKDAIFPSSTTAKSRAARSSAATALKTGIKAEKDSIIFYSELIDLVPQSDRAAVNKILAEEKQHLWQLMEYQRKSGS